MLQAAPQQSLCGLLDLWRVHPAIGLGTQRIEVTFEPSRKLNAYHAEPVILNSSVQFLASRKCNRAHRFNNRCMLRLRIFRSAVTESRRARCRFRPENAAQTLHFNRFGNVKEAKDPKVALYDHRRRARSSQKCAANYRTHPTLFGADTRTSARPRQSCGTHAGNGTR